MDKGRVILKHEILDLMITRLAHQLIEKYDDFANTAMIGIQDRGVLFSDRLFERIKSINKKKLPEYGRLDITFYRDDFRMGEKPLKASSMDIDFLIVNKKVILIDDVLYTGRTIQAALAALQDFGRPASVELLCLVDRRFNRHLPVSADYVGTTIDALNEAYVKVSWGEDKNEVIMFSGKNQI